MQQIMKQMSEVFFIVFIKHLDGSSTNSNNPTDVVFTL